MGKSKLSASLEDYLETIYRLCRDNPNAHAHTNQISEELKVAKSSVSWALSQLGERGLINYERYAPVTLTEKGQELAARVWRRHDGLKKFLVEVLDINEDLAEANACRMEHIVDRRIIDKMRTCVSFLDSSPDSTADFRASFRKFCAEPAEQTQTPEQEVDLNIPKSTKERDEQVLLRLTEILQESGRELDEDELTIVAVFMACEKHLTIDEIHKEVRKKRSRISHEQVVEVMIMLCEHKIARILSFGRQVVYEHLHPESHHDHLYCVKCGAIVEFYDPEIEMRQLEQARNANFRPLIHRLDIQGVCQNCINLEGRTRSLDKCLTGERVQIVRVVAETEIRKRIADMGLLEAKDVEILSNDCCGHNLLLLLGHTRMMLDRELAAKLRVAPVGLADLERRHRCHRRGHQHRPDRLGE